MKHKIRETQRAEVRVQLRAEDEMLPPGVAGQISGIALTFDTVDTYGTVFARGCAKRSIDTKVAAGRLPLMLDHEWETEAHVGVVRELVDTGTGYLMTADLFATEEGQEARRYVRNVLAADAYVGLSIGFRPIRSEMVTIDGQAVERFTEIELREISLTPLPSVPGTDVVAARSDRAEPDTTAVPSAVPAAPRDDAALLALAARTALHALSPEARAAVLSEYLTPEAPEARSACSCASTHATEPTTASTPGDAVSMDARMAALRTTFL